MTFFLKWIVLPILALAGLFEGISYSLSFLNVASDAAVLGGVLLLFLTISLFVSFAVWYIRRIGKATNVGRPTASLHI